LTLCLIYVVPAHIVSFTEYEAEYGKPTEATIKRFETKEYSYGTCAGYYGGDEC
jgi:hypothetical protein